MPRPPRGLMSLFTVVVLKDREEKEKEQGAENGVLELSSREHAKNYIITPAKIYPTLYNF